ncbi:hypothetical protein GCM10007160_20190 [Litchfieldella qijiaojingensis]|uniref:DUF2835 family protein n=1 Tax=Litchfieldella qijiaojingensis TaxID=980347 RepID=A0ABQ2YSX7_9GAMM|nr:DUF2835 family protein [Halomonas qijiaojingensis]GGX92653.1 hypothetical protein GCM10007160_20190 [Halomonas qijiaojingensis]
MPSIDVVINLTREECLAHYEGWARNVRARSLDGRRVIFPATALRHIVGRNGVDGVYRLTYSESGKFESIVALREN